MLHGVRGCHDENKKSFRGKTKTQTVILDNPRPVMSQINFTSSLPAII